MDSTVLILEAMKMETEIKAPTAGVIGKIFVKPGDTVKPGTPLFEVIN
jgi:biotin carboxyl carrier protein